MHNMVPEYISRLFKLSEDTFYYSRSAQNQNLKQIYCKTDLVKQSFSYTSMSVWNELPLCIKTSSSLAVFKAKCIKHLYESENNFMKDKKLSCFCVCLYIVCVCL